MSLSEKVCVPCQGGIPPLTRDQAEFFARETPEWTLSEDATRIMRQFQFDDFAGSFEFVSRVSMLAEAEGHHPDISFGWGYVDIMIFTHKIKGLHENDFILAAKIDELQ